MNREILKALPLSVLKSIPSGAAQDPVLLRQHLKANLPVDQLRQIADQVSSAEKLTPDEQVEGSARSIAAKVTGGTSEAVVPVLDALAIDQSHGRPNPNPEHSFSKMIENIKAKFTGSQERGKRLIEKIPAGEAAETIARSVAEGPTFGLSEPIISAAKAGFNTVTDGPPTWEKFKNAFYVDVVGREAAQEKLPFVDKAAQFTGFAAAPTGLLRKGAEKLTRAAAPGVASKLFGKSLIPQSAQGFWPWMGREAEAIAKTAGKLGVDVAEQAAARNLTLKPFGFVGEEEPGVAEAGKTGAAIGATLRGLGTAGKALGEVSKYALPVFFGGSNRGFNKQAVDYYLANWRRLGNKEANLGQLSDEIMDSIQKIRDDFNASVINEQTAKKAVDELTDQVKVAKIDQKNELMDRLKEAKNALNLEFQQAKAEIRNFQRHLPGEMLDDIQASVATVRKDLVATHIQKLEALKDSPAKVPLADITEVFDDAIKDLQVNGQKAFGDVARQAIATLKRYRKRIAAFGDEIPPLEAWKIVKQARDDTKFLDSSTGFMGATDSASSRFAGELQQRIIDAVGEESQYGALLAENREIGRFMDQLGNYFDTPEATINSLKRIGAPESFLQRDTLLRLGQHTGKDFGKAVKVSEEASRVAQSPKALDELKQNFAEAQLVRDLESQMDEFRNPRRMAQEIRATVEATPEYQAYLQAQQAKEAAGAVDDIFQGFTDMTVENKVRSIMMGKEALRRRMQALSQLSDRDFVQAIDDLSVLSGFNKSAFQGSRRVNAFATMGYAATSNASPEKRMTIAALAAGGAMFMDTYGPRMARRILDGVARINGMVTAQKLLALPLPRYIRKDLVNQFGRALYYGEYGNFNPNVSLSPQEAMLVKEEIRNSEDLSKAEKARNITEINRTGKVPDFNKLLMGENPIPREEHEEVERRNVDGLAGVSERIRNLR